MLTSGQILGDRYRLDEPVAAGGMGEVWRATDTVLGRLVAIKVLHSRRAGDPEFQSRFRHEARTMAALHHPGVVDVYDYGETDDGAFLVMSYVDGEPLDQRIAAAGRLEPGVVTAIVAQAARALEAAHAAGVVHRDVKPGNLIVKPDGGVVLVDFGVARSAESTVLTGVNEVIGTALYIAPEQVSKQKTGPATDIYALGAVAYHCLAGRPPFHGDNPVTVAIHHLSDEPPPLPADTPDALRELVATAMAKNPANRFPSAAAMADAAEAIDGRGPTAGADGASTVLPGATTVPPGATAGTSPRDRRRTALIWAGVLVALTTLGAVFAFAGPTGLLPGPSGPPATPRIEAPVSPGGSGGGSNPAGVPGVSGGPSPTPGGGTSQGGATGGPGTVPTPPPTPGSTPGPTGAPEPTTGGGGTPSAAPASA